MNRAFYTCHAKAAIMAKYHGMQFEDELGNPATYHYPIGFSIEALNDDMIGEPVGWGGVLYIRSDSMHKLEPQQGDLHKSYAVESGWVVINYDKKPRIIQRNGLAFMWPEVEP